MLKKDCHGFKHFSNNVIRNACGIGHQNTSEADLADFILGKLKMSWIMNYKITIWKRLSSAEIQKKIALWQFQCIMSCAIL